MSGERQAQGYRLARGVRLRREAFGGIVFEPQSGLLLTVGPAVFGLLEALAAGSVGDDVRPPAGLLEGLCDRGVLVAVPA